MFDTTLLPTTSSKRDLRWRQTDVALLLVRAGGDISQAYKLEDKRALISDLQPADCLLAVQNLQYPKHPEVLVVDDLDAVRSALVER
jgi:hypothetical protein